MPPIVNELYKNQNEINTELFVPFMNISESLNVINY